jgi:hypothetical protein
VRKTLATTSFTAVVLAAAASGASAQTTAPNVVTPPPQVALKLINGWTNAPFGTGIAKVEALSGVVRFKGAIATAGTNPAPFILPAAYRPASDVYVPIDMCNATNGRLYIQPTGAVTVQAETSFSNAQCFTSLDGVSFDRNTNGVTALNLVNGWSSGPFATANAAFRSLSGVVQLKGAIATGTTGQAFTLPVGARPSADVYVPVDMCNATNGRLYVQPTGAVTVMAESSFSNAQCFTSLDGASFAINAVGITPLTLVNGWVNAPFSTRIAAFRNISGVVYFTGAIATTGTNATPFTLPGSVRPAKPVYVKVDMCNGTNGRLVIQPSGVVTVQAASSFSNAQCFTSLEGTSFVR